LTPHAAHRFPQEAKQRGGEREGDEAESRRIAQDRHQEGAGSQSADASSRVRFSSGFQHDCVLELTGGGLEGYEPAAEAGVLRMDQSIYETRLLPRAE